MVVDDKLYSPQEYVELVTGDYYCYNGDSDIDFIESVLKDNGLESLWNYPLCEIDEIVANDLNVVLVDCLDLKEELNSGHVLRWFEVPENAMHRMEE